MRLFIPSIVLAIAYAIASCSARVVQYPSHIRVKRNSYIVQLHPTAQARCVQAIPGIQVSRHFDMFHGVAVSIGDSVHPSQVANIEGVKAVWPNRVFSLQYQNETTNGSDEYLHQATRVHQAHTELGLNGTGIKIGIIDTGVDYTHPDLGACWKTPNCPWQYGGSYASDSLSPNDPPMDCMGHGTHVSGIIASRGDRVKGVAPQATLGMYRVFTCSSESADTNDANVIAAMEAAFQDGHDIISMSLGSETAWEEDPVAVLASKFVDAGVVMVVANGNSGASGLLTASTPAVGRNVISVGSVDNWNITSAHAIFTTHTGQHSVLFLPSAAPAPPFIIANNTLVVSPTDNTGSALACTNITNDLSGKVALIQRGECTFSEKALNAQNAGAVAVVIYNNVDGMVDMAFDSNILIPGAFISMNDGRMVEESIRSGRTLVRALESDLITMPSPSGGHMSAFSSLGPTAELGLVPLISAPGGNILSTYPQSMGSYTSLSGTSMAAPYVAGAVALLKQARPDITVTHIRELLVTTARPIADSSTGLVSNPYSSGGGLINIYDAIRARARIDPPLLSINNTRREHPGPINSYIRPINAYWEIHTLAIQNTDSAKSMRISLAHISANSLTMFDKNGTLSQQLLTNQTMPTWPTNTSPVPANTLPQVLGIRGNTLVRPGQSTNITVFIAPPLGLPESERWFYGGFINFKLTWDGESTAFSHVVPYAGFNGDMHKLSVLASAPIGLPFLADSELEPIENVSELTISADTDVYLAVALDLPTRIFAASIVDATNTTRGYLPLGYSEYVGRTLLDEAPYYTIPVNRTVFHDTQMTNSSELSAGSYHVHLKVLRPFGDPARESDFQIWDSDTFKLGD
ncbi:hypothetical protein IWW43_001138 [Coemansia sp. RSA 1935]|nr:hypothetical protein IWW46_001073 [Coemansia sp. RSA 2440]KAJ2536092.1 hypothetical protein IWW43_001138 [Coemansia sp. RSA 1935]